MDTPEPEERQIRRYVESQTREADSDPVTLVQLVGRRRVAGRTHKLYDVWMEKGSRWWVITNLTNLYSQEQFNSIEEAFTYHLGLCLILGERSRISRRDEEDEHVSRAWRRYAMAVEAMNQAEEAEDFQAVGIRCREALLALVREHVDAPWVPEAEPRPRVADFKDWLRIHAASLTVGRARSHLHSLAETTWDLAVWLQHYRDATDLDAEIVLEATAHLLHIFALSRTRHERGATRRCPLCDSYRVTEDGDVAQESGQYGYAAHDVCLACGWESDSRFDPWSPDYLRRLAEYAAGDDEGE